VVLLVETLTRWLGKDEEDAHRQSKAEEPRGEVDVADVCSVRSSGPEFHLEVD
jgi:hypothetical protein